MSIHPFNSQSEGQARTSAMTWQERLDQACSRDEVVDIARTFLAAFTPYEIHALPAPCQPPPKLFAEDIAPYAFELVRHECSTPETAEIVHQLAHFFSHASTRIAQLASSAARGDGGLEEQQQSA
jgi:hypothetical protein